MPADVRVFGRTLDANFRSFASKNKPMQDRHLTACNAVLGRFGRKIPEHFIEEGRGETATRTAGVLAIPGESNPRRADLMRFSFFLSTLVTLASPGCC